MKIGSAFPSKWLKASDLPDGKFISVTIERVELEKVGMDSEDDKPVMYFVGKSKGLVLNKTKANAISAAYGEETEDWSGRPLQLYATEVAFQGKMVASIGIKIPKGGAAAAPNGSGRAAVPAGRGNTPFEEEAPSFDSEEPPF